MNSKITLAFAVIFYNNIYCQSLSVNKDKYNVGSITPQGLDNTNSFFNSFAGSINTLFNKNQAGASFDLSVQTYHYFFVTGKKTDTAKVHLKDGTTLSNGVKDRYRGFDFYLLNRAAINFDSLKTIANDYLTPLQTSPLTIRINKEFFLTKNKEITENDYSPVVSILITGDARAIPFGDLSSKVNLGASGHLFCTFSTLFKRIEFDPQGNEIDKGTMYFQPTFGMVYGTDDMMKNVFLDGKNRLLLTSELRFGFKSDKYAVKDWGLLVRYT